MNAKRSQKRLCIIFNKSKKIFLLVCPFVCPLICVCGWVCVFEIDYKFVVDGMKKYISYFPTIQLKSDRDIKNLA